MKPLTGRVPPEAVRPWPVPRLPAETAPRLLALDDLTSTLSDAMDNLGLVGVVAATRLACNLPGARVVGQAVTVRNAERSDAPGHAAASGQGRMGEHEAYNQAEPGDVIVIEGVPDVSNLGGQSAALAQRSQCAGAVVDGGHRDPAMARGLGFPIWSRGPTPVTGKWRLQTVEINGPVRIAGVTVHAGDLVAADEAGIVFVPHARVADVLAEAERIAAGDSRQRADIAAGASLSALAERRYK